MVECQAIDVFSDSTGVYRTFEAGASTVTGNAAGEADGMDGIAASASSASRTAAIRMGQQARMQLTDQQLKRLQEEKPAITEGETTAEAALHSAQGSQWLAILTQAGQLQVSCRTMGLGWTGLTGSSARCLIWRSCCSRTAFPPRRRASPTMPRRAHQARQAKAT